MAGRGGPWRLSGPQPSEALQQLRSLLEGEEVIEAGQIHAGREVRGLLLLLHRLHLLLRPRGRRATDGRERRILLKRDYRLLPHSDVFIPEEDRVR